MKTEIELLKYMYVQHEFIIDAQKDIIRRMTEFYTDWGR